MDFSELYRDVVETSPDGIWVIDLEGRTVYANPEIARMHRVPESALAGLTVFDTLDEPGRAQFAAHLDDVRQGRVNPAEVEVQWVRSDGEIMWVRCRENALLDADGTAWALLHRYSDDTERHELIASLRASEDALEDQVAQNDLMQAVASAANEASTLADVLVHARSLVLLHDDWERARAFVPSADGGVEPFYPVPEDRDADRDDPFAPVELELARRAHASRGAVWDERRLTIAFPVLVDEQVHAVVVITSAPPLWRFELIESMVGRVAEQLSRVAERERARAQLSAARDEAMEASRQKSEFLATMSHEIRTPLNGVIGLNDLLLRTSLDPEQQRLAAGVQVASRALLGLINDILDFSKIEAGRLELEHLDFELRPLLDQVVGMLAEPARDKGLDLAVAVHPDVPAVLGGDPTRLAQVVTNLVSNAVKFTERGGVVVRASAEVAGPERVRLRVEVSDSGIGVAPEKLEQLFDPFTQADSSTTRIYGGTGLGLAISREIVEAMGGTIEHAAHPLGGSVFTATAVLDLGSADAVGDPSGSAADSEARELLSGRRALVVDDNATNRLIVTEQLAWWGVDSDAADSAAAALDLVAAGAAYDVVLLDLAMPGEDGLDLARRLRTQAPGAEALAGVPLVMLTSVTTLDPAVARDAGISELMSKPVLPSLLRGTLVRLLAPQPAEPAPTAGPTNRPVGRGRVLVVEDNPVNQMVATGLLSALGYATEVADDGVAAIEAAASGAFDAVLMDVQMPRMDGYTATRHIREAEGGVRRPIIAMTAAAVEGERERCLAAGMDDYLTKPVDPARLAETLDRWVGGASSASSATAAPAVAPAADPAPSAAYDRLDVSRLEELRELDAPDAVTSYVEKAVSNFLATGPQMRTALEEAVAGGDPDQVRAVAHRLAGAALNLGATALGEAARSVEHHAVDGDLAGAGAALPGLGERLEADLAALAAYRDEQFPVRA